jgi:hypothetical protein
MRPGIGKEKKDRIIQLWIQVSHQQGQNHATALVVKQLHVPRSTVNRIIAEAEVRRGEEPTWTEERIEILNKLEDEGKGFTKIAAVLGDGITRDAVWGRINRKRGYRKSGSKKESDQGSAIDIPQRPARRIDLNGLDGNEGGHRKTPGMPVLKCLQAPPLEP